MQARWKKLRPTNAQMQVADYHSKQVLIEESSPVIHNSEQENKSFHSFHAHSHALDVRLIQQAEGLIA